MQTEDKCKQKAYPQHIYSTKLSLRAELHQLTYSAIPLNKIDIFFEMLWKGVETGKGWEEERERGDGTANFVVGLATSMFVSRSQLVEEPGWNLSGTANSHKLSFSELYLSNT
jgi:hypothetical protein